HHQVQLVTLVGIRSRHRLVELDAEPGLARWGDVAVLPGDPAYEVAVEATPVLDRFENQQVGDARAELDVRRPLDRPGIEVGRHLGVVRLGHGGDLLGLQYPADAAERGLENGGRTAGQHAGELPFRAEALAGRDGDAGRAGDL